MYLDLPSFDFFPISYGVFFWGASVVFFFSYLLLMSFFLGGGFESRHAIFKAFFYEWLKPLLSLGEWAVLGSTKMVTTSFAIWDVRWLS